MIRIVDCLLVVDSLGRKLTVVFILSFEPQRQSSCVVELEASPISQSESASMSTSLQWAMSVSFGRPTGDEMSTPGLGEGHRLLNTSMTRNYCE